ncbi:MULTISPECIES: carbohydrate ABC transporter permease [unclassified Rhizobium]|uniref:carbohydrate ABC transporter permease n=1 Tax=unclassified Rhizobium TaxID=2613769 RepID=UPI001ADA9BF1|nr:MULTISPECIES: sugar ABC transporter permease [unclassified Rhizobium]MBO9101670.1 sugar ABC transporter permease [Rhizobium sp. L58/93]MBO9187726.1 sugar ABC transporter permease [Rhizobium sp. E27B/91]QXZ86381.1 sugar ABC transporter permease [Rhizobium sp. K1/93]QXZ92164.1 sugar ABC transporter permease [Rhizobium sp. K15/93]
MNPKRKKIPASLVAKVALVPSIVLCAVGFYGAMLWTVVVSFTDSGIVPHYDFVGLKQYAKLFSTDRWHVAYTNMFIFGGLYIASCLVFGIILAIALDQGARARSFFQTIFLYPIALSFIVTGLSWQWLLNPTTGLQNFARSLGFESFAFDWLSSPTRAIYTLVLAGVWHASGLVMAIIYAGLGSVDNEIWRASRVDGIPRARMYWRVILPMLKPVIIVCVVLLAMDVIKSYELVVAMTAGGPGYSTDLPAKFVVDTLFTRTNIGLASAAATLMLASIVVMLLLFGWLQKERPAQ